MPEIYDLPVERLKRVGRLADLKSKVLGADKVWEVPTELWRCFPELEADPNKYNAFWDQVGRPVAFYGDDRVRVYKRDGMTQISLDDFKLLKKER